MVAAGFEIPVNVQYFDRRSINGLVQLSDVVCQSYQVATAHSNVCVKYQKARLTLSCGRIRRIHDQITSSSDMFSGENRENHTLLLSTTGKKSTIDFVHWLHSNEYISRSELVSTTS